MKDKKIKTHINYNSFIILFLFLLIIIYFLPALLQKEKMFYDDVYSSFTRIVAVARSVQNGEIPLWDKSLFCGARPFYTMMEGAIYNILLYPFFFVANTDNLNNAFLILYVIPFLLFLIFGFFGIYLFLQKILGCSKLASLVTGFVYITTPALTSVSFLCIHDQIIHVFLPWVLYVTFSYIKENKIKWWWFSYLTIVLMFLGYSINYTIRAFFIIFFITFIYLTYLFFKKEIKLKTFFNLGLIYIFAFFSVSFLWFGVYEGINWLDSKSLISYKELVEGISNNLYPGQIINKFIPDFHGLVTCRNTWGNSIYSTNGNLPSGSFFTSFVLFIYLIFYKKVLSRNEKLFFYIFASLFIISILVMLGRFTPFFYMFQLILPWFFRVPYPYYYQIAENFSYVILIGISLDFFIKKEGIIRENLKIKHLFIYILIIVLLIIFSIIEPLYDDLDNNRGYIPAIYSLIAQNELFWFFTNPLLYFLISFFIALILFFLKNNLKITHLFILFLIFDTFYFGYLNLYKNSVFSDKLKNEHSDPIFRKSFSSRSKNPIDSPLLHDSYNLKKVLNNNRFIGTLSIFDNIAWAIDGYAALGYDSKPITKEMYNIVKKIAENYPYELTFKNKYVNYLRNMNVGYLIFMKYQALGKFYIAKRDDTYYYLNENEVTSDDKIIAELKIESVNKKNNAENETSLYFTSLVEPLPYVYTQDKIFITNKENQLELLLKNDLRNHVLYNEKIDKLKIVELRNEDKLIIEDNLEFENLQRLNKINIIERKNNKLKVEVEVEIPALLIRTEVFHPGWHVKVDGKREKLLKVNYIQQAIFLDKGNHIIEFYFLPESFLIGLIISVITILLAIFYSIFSKVFKNF